MIIRTDVLKLPFADQSVDLVLGSPPYCDARTYDDGTLPEGHVVSRGCEDWIEWMLAATTECLRVSKGAVIWVVGSVTRDWSYWPAPEGLAYRWWQQGGSMFRPVFWHRVGIPGSGGEQWFRSDVEFCLCFKRAGRLPWSDNTAMGHPPKWAPGGEMSHRLSNGAKVNQWGPVSSQGRGRDKNGKPKKGGHAPSHRYTKAEKVAADAMREQAYFPPAIANPGNLIQTGAAGGGRIGDWMAHENEAPFPEKLAEWFVLSLCPPGGTVLDPFIGSGTTAKVAKQHGRMGIGTDIRTSQTELSRRRIAEVQPVLF
jgi:hypothetical protein